MADPVVSLTGAYQVIGICSAVVGIATAYLRLYIGARMAALKELICEKLDRQYVTQGQLDTALALRDQRLATLEKRA